MSDFHEGLNSAAIARWAVEQYGKDAEYMVNETHEVTDVFNHVNLEQVTTEVRKLLRSRRPNADD